MAEETLIHAARRVLRFMRIDDVNGGGLLSIETIKAGSLLDRAIVREEAKQKRNPPPPDLDPDPAPSSEPDGPAPTAPAAAATVEA